VCRGISLVVVFAVLVTAEKLLRRVCDTWQAHKLIGALSPEQVAAVRQKIETFNIFGGGNKPWNCARKFQGNYLELPSNPLRKKYVQAMTTAVARTGDAEIRYGRTRVGLDFLLVTISADGVVCARFMPLSTGLCWKQVGEFSGVLYYVVNAIRKGAKVVAMDLCVWCVYSILCFRSGFRTMF